MIGPFSGMALALALAGAAGSATGSGPIQVGIQGAAGNQPASSLAQHARREQEAESLLRKALAACDRALSNPHLLPSEFGQLETAYKEDAQQAVLEDASLRSASTLWRGSSGTAATYDSWLTRCDAWFGANHDTFAAAASAESAAMRGRPLPARGKLVTCKVQAGKVGDCGDLYSGPAAILREGTYLKCEVVAGDIRSCSTPFEGTSAVEQAGSWHECDLAAGKILACSELGFDGAVGVAK